jgi:hypothetical protein
MVNGKIDMTASPVVNYLARKDGTEVAQIDELYDAAAAFCVENDRWSISALRKEFGIGSPRATRLIGLLKANNAKERSKKGKVKKTFKHAESKPQPPKPVPTSQPATTVESTSEIRVPERLEEFLDWKMRDLIAQFGTDSAFLDWLKALKTLEEICDKRLKNAVSEGKLVSRDLIKRGVFDHFENAHTKMLTDGVKKIVKTISTLVEAKHDVSDMEKEVSDILGSIIRPAKAKITKTFKSLEQT